MSRSYAWLFPFTNTCVRFLFKIVAKYPASTRNISKTNTFRIVSKTRDALRYVTLSFSSIKDSVVGKFRNEDAHPSNRSIVTRPWESLPKSTETSGYYNHLQPHFIIHTCRISNRGRNHLIEMKPVVHLSWKFYLIPQEWEWTGFVGEFRYEAPRWVIDSSCRLPGTTVRN